MEEIFQAIEAQVEQLTPELIALRRELHQHPELSHQEEHTAQVVANYLRHLGLEEIKTGIAGLGVTGLLRGGRSGRTVAYRADMDALPITEQTNVPWRSRREGVMHACGHDFHMSVALVAVKLLARLKDRLAGQFRFIFQPAEEGPPREGASGAQGMAAAGVLKDPPVEAILALHVAPNLDTGQIRYCQEVVMAGADRVILTITGKEAHGATPHRGVDPILAMAQAINLIQGFLAQKIDARHPVVLTFGTISGGRRFNILADRVTLEGSLRFLKEAVREEVVRGLQGQMAGLAQATGARIDLRAEPTYPITVNNPRLAAQAVEVLRRILSDQRLKSHHPAMGSEDFSFFAAQVPAFYFFLGVRTPGSRGQALHSPEFNPDEAALPWGLRAAATLLVSLSEPEFPFPRSV